MKVVFLDCVHLQEVYFKTVSSAIAHVLKEQYEFDFSKVNVFMSDNAGYMTKAFNDVLRFAFLQAEHVTRTAYVIDLGVQGFITNIPTAN